MFPEWTAIVGFWIGAAVGSFLNVVIYRLPRGLSISKPKHSFCTVCKKQLSILELIPLLSWLWQRGKCKCGDSKVSPRYFIVELLTGLLWAAIWYQKFVVSSDPLYAYSHTDFIQGIGYMVFSAALISAIFTDIALYVIPDQINAAMLLTGFGMNIAYFAMHRKEAVMWGMPSSVAGALVGFGLLWTITLAGRLAFGKDAMGHGDIKMARGIGAVLLPFAAGISFAFAVLFGALFGVGVLLYRVLAKDKGVPDGQTDEDEAPYEPESIKSILWCGLGYVLLIDVIGLFIPKLYEWWFGENPFAFEVEEGSPQVDLTMIPFGPHLAVGALVAMLFGPQLQAAVLKYFGM